MLLVSSTAATQMELLRVDVRSEWTKHANPLTIHSVWSLFRGKEVRLRHRESGNNINQSCIHTANG